MYLTVSFFCWCSSQRTIYSSCFSYLNSEEELNWQNWRAWTQEKHWEEKMKLQQNWKFHILRKELVASQKMCKKPLWSCSKPVIHVLADFTVYTCLICFKHLQSQRTLCFYSNEELWWDLEMFKIMSVSFLCVTKYMTTAVVVTVMLTMCLWQRQRTQKSGWLVPKCTLVRWLSILPSPQDCSQ